MPLAMLFGGTIAPMLLVLAPLSLATARNCIDWEPVAKARDTPARADRASPCPRPPLILM